MDTKPCKRCGRPFLGKGRQTICDECHKTDNRKYAKTFYNRHREKVRAEQNQRVQANPEVHKLAKMRWDMEHREERLEKNREYYKKNRERLLEEKQEKNWLFYSNSFDYGWTKAFSHDQTHFKLWKDRTYAEICKQEAIEFIELLEKRLSPVERTILDCLVDANFDATTAADMMSVSIHDFTETLAAIRQVAVKVRSTEWTPGFWTW